MKRYILLSMVSVALFSCKEQKTADVKPTANNIDSLLQVYPDSVDFLVFRSDLHFQNYQFEAALADGAKAFRLDSTNQMARKAYANALNNQLNRTPQEVKIAQRHYLELVRKNPKDCALLVSLATTYGYLQDFEKAFKYTNDALRIDPKYRDAYVFKGSMYLLMDDREKAKSSYETAVQQDPKFYEGYLRLAAIYLEEDNPIALEYYKTAYSIKPNEPELLYSLAYAKEQFNKVNEAMYDYRRLSRDTSEYYSSRGFFHIGHVHQFRNNQLDSAKIYYEKALLSFPEYVEAYHNLGMIYESRGQVEQALANYSKALKYNPNFELSRQAAEKYRPLDQ